MIFTIKVYLSLQPHKRNAHQLFLFIGHISVELKELLVLLSTIILYMLDFNNIQLYSTTLNAKHIQSVYVRIHRDEKLGTNYPMASVLQHIIQTHQIGIHELNEMAGSNKTESVALANDNQACSTSGTTVTTNQAIPPPPTATATITTDETVSGTSDTIMDTWLQDSSRVVARVRNPWYEYETVIKGPNETSDWSQFISSLCKHFRTRVCREPMTFKANVYHDKLSQNAFSISNGLPLGLVLCHYERYSDHVNWTVCCTQSPANWYLHFCAFLYWGFITDCQTTMVSTTFEFPWGRHVRSCTYSSQYDMFVFYRQLEQCEYVQRYPEQVLLYTSAYLQSVRHNQYVHDLTSQTIEHSDANNITIDGVYSQYIQAVYKLMETYNIYQDRYMGNHLFKCTNPTIRSTFVAWNVVEHRQEVLHSLLDIDADSVVLHNVSQSNEDACIMCPRSSLYKHVQYLERFGTQYVNLQSVGLAHAIVPAHTWWSFLRNWFSHVHLIRLACMHCLYVGMDDAVSETLEINNDQCSRQQPKCPSHLWVYRIVCVL